MSTIYYDPDEWETVVITGERGGGSWASCGQKRRAPEDVARIKAERRRADEDKILAEAEAIQKARAANASPSC